jgi:hypothetical protein
MVVIMDRIYKALLWEVPQIHFTSYTMHIENKLENKIKKFKIRFGTVRCGMGGEPR